MNMIDRIQSTEEATSLRDHIAKVLMNDLSLNLKQRKLDELVSHLIGAKDWNTALGTITNRSKKLTLVSEIPERRKIPIININFKDAWDVIEGYLAETKDPHFDYKLTSVLAEWRATHPNYDNACKSIGDSKDLLGIAYEQFGEQVVVEMLIGLGIEQKAFQDRDYLRHFEYLTEEQIDDAFSACLDSTHEPAYDASYAFKMDSSLRNGLMVYLESRGD